MLTHPYSYNGTPVGAFPLSKHEQSSQALPLVRSLRGAVCLQEDSIQSPCFLGYDREIMA